MLTTWLTACIIVYIVVLLYVHTLPTSCVYINKVRDGTLSTSYLSLCHNGQRKYNKGRLLKGKSVRKKSREVEKQFALREEELESIFDIIEQEFPDL